MNRTRNREESLRLSYEVNRRIEAEREYEFERKLKGRAPRPVATPGEQKIAGLAVLMAREYPLADRALIDQLQEADRQRYGSLLRLLRGQVDLQLRLHRQWSVREADFESMVVMRLRVEWAFARLAVVPLVKRWCGSRAYTLFGESAAVLRPILSPGYSE